MRSLLVFSILLVIKGLSSLFWRLDMEWVDDPPGDPWTGNRIVAILNHTSLFEPVFAGGTPPRFLWAVARHGVVPVAQKTMERPVVGRLFGAIAAHVVSVSRQRDHTWQEVLATIEDPEAMVTILPEGRMKRPGGLDKNGKPMTVRGGVADILRAIPDGKMLLAYSGGLHHVQAPGERFPRLFRTVRMRLESVSIADYRATLLAEAGEEGFRGAVIADLTRRRDLWCGRLEAMGE